MDAPNNAEKKRRRKIQFKFKDRRGGAYGTLSAKLKKKNDKAKQKNDDRESKSWLQNDMILIWLRITLISKMKMKWSFKQSYQ